ncbi:MAG: ribokinase [Nitriliruptoraceae bacterium]|nr:ribokinase [Nitriliruptoraceae bacterium]
MSSVVVIGACMLDLISYVPRLPASGETLHGSTFQMGYGGKGANQAVMAAKLGASVTLISKVGSDVFGDGTYENLTSVGIDTAHVHRAKEAFSGVAPIAVDSDGNNSIIIVSGANDELTADEVEAARPAIAAAGVLVAQLEIPVELSLAALRIAREEGTTTILNPAPAREELPEEAYELADVFCPNEPETELLTGIRVSDADAAREGARILRSRGARAVVLTLGSRGCLVVDDDGATDIPTDTVEVVDTTGAGDAFVGVLAQQLSSGADLRRAAAHASRVASQSVMARGTQSSFPGPDDLPSELRAAIVGT